MTADAVPSAKSNDRRIDYIEFPARDLAATKRFYEEAFSWQFTDYGPDYTSFVDGRLAGGFAAGAKEIANAASAPLIVIYAADIQTMEKKVRDSGGKIVKGIFEFPGGRRFHFTDPSGNELAIWSE
jgi:predicted enzyme related to lactoylglutathione lyase